MIPQLPIAQVWASQAGTWSKPRLRFAGLSVVVAVITAAVVAVLAGEGFVFGPRLYVVVTFLALFFPGAITVQVMLGQALIAQLLLAEVGPAPLLLLPAFAGVIAGAELLAVVARLDSALQRKPVDVMPRVGLAAAGGALVFGAVVMLAGLPGPSGMLAVVLAAAACGLMAARLVRGAEGEGQGG